MCAIYFFSNTYCYSKNFVAWCSEIKQSNHCTSEIGRFNSIREIIRCRASKVFT